MQLETMSNTAVARLPAYCYTDEDSNVLDDDDREIFTERVCVCYSDHCNAAASDINLPQLVTGDVTCISQLCTSDGCTNIGKNGACKGLYCYAGNQNAETVSTVTDYIMFRRAYTAKKFTSIRCNNTYCFRR